MIKTLQPAIKEFDRCRKTFDKKIVLGINKPYSIPLVAWDELCRPKVREIYV